MYSAFVVVCKVSFDNKSMTRNQRHENVLQWKYVEKQLSFLIVS